ncbi:MAG: hypothetical protein KatS3mg022_0308 [Armatimonadota bacterium]|jgi:hypothetical protein|nr:MAG: hypothetical protein KatS3mg022_0308 [Armatimonadota bacterium]
MDIQAKIAILELQQSRFEPSFSETERFNALNDVRELILSIERELQQMGTDPDPFAQVRLAELRRRFQSALQQLARSGVSVPLPTGVTL